MIKIILAVVISIVISFSLEAKNDRNVIFIALDDFKPILKSYGNSIIHTPNMDRLASEGVVFTNNHCQQAVCGPSRASLLTGLRPDRTGVWDLKTLIRDVNPNIITLPQFFKNSGYVTTGVGKIFDKRSVDNDHDKISWSQPFSFLPNDSYYDKEFGMPAIGSFQDPATKKKIEKLLIEAEENGLKGYDKTKYAQSKMKLSSESADVTDNAYNDGAITNYAIDKLDKLSKDGEPFFMAVGFKKPHLPFVSPKKYWDLYNRNEIPLAQYQQPAKGSLKQSYTKWEELRSYADIQKLTEGEDVMKLKAMPDDKQRELIHAYYASISYIDAQIGKLITKLKQLDQYENTIIIIWGDHGWHLGDHGLWCKHTNFEQATRSPLLIYDGSNRGIVSSPTEFVDIFPTLCELTGLEIPSNLEGESLVPTMRGDKADKNSYAVSQFTRGNKTMGYAFRTDDLRYVVWYDIDFRKDLDYSKMKIIGEELYDYKLDPLERENLITKSDYKKKIKRVRDIADSYFKQQPK